MTTCSDEVWASYRFIAIADAGEPDGIRVIDLGAGHASAGETLCGRMIAALKAESLLNESVGAGYIVSAEPKLRVFGRFENAAFSSLRWFPVFFRTAFI